MSPENFLISMLLLSINTIDVADLSPKAARITKYIGICQDNENADIIMQKIRLNTIGKSTSVSMRIVIRNDINEDMKLFLKMKRCKSRDALDTCEAYVSPVINHMCRLIGGEGKPWTEFVKNMQPPMPSCPLKKGIYVLSNGTLAGPTVSSKFLGNWYWIVEAQLIGELSRKVIMCNLLEGQVVDG